MDTSRMPNSPMTQTLSGELHSHRLPQELEDMIISHVYDIDTLRSCSMTCFAWHSRLRPRLHYSLTAFGTSDHGPREWPKPLQESHDLGLLPLVRRLSILDQRLEGFTLERFRMCNLSYFSAFTNLRELEIEGLQVSSFMPNIQQCFEGFAPTIESLALCRVGASCRQILHLIGLFKNLQDFKLFYFRLIDENEDSVTADFPLIRHFEPPLCGWLTLRLCRVEELLNGMVALYGGLRFRYVDLCHADCMGRVLDECADTLEILRLQEDPHDHANDFIRSRCDLAVSRCKSLRTLEIGLSLPSPNYRFIPSFLKATILAIESPAPLDLVMVYNEQFFSFGCGSLNHRTKWFERNGGKCAKCDINHLGRFKALDEIHRERSFRLVLCAEVPGSMVASATRALRRSVEAHCRGYGLDRLLSGSSVIYTTVPPKI